MHDLVIKRIYEKAEPGDGYRILVDRIWPRGISKEEARLDFWARDMAPSADVRKAFGHDPAKMDVFSQQYLAELDQNPAAAEYLQIVADELGHGQVTLLYSAKDQKHNQAEVLIDWTEKKLQRQ
ncbi:MAG: DUF488 domain-containing protein [Syntrophomonadaceae bacterium]|nr:DUF488 domain-containing protein [Syntrophomonadaceae bacterium]